MKVGISSDHGGFELKEKIKSMLKVEGYEIIDFGAFRIVQDDDYPDFVIPMALAVAEGQVERAIAICGSGVGACVAANKIPGVRAGLITDYYSAHQGVEDDKMNVMCLGGRVSGFNLSMDLVRVFLKSKFNGDERFVRRLDKIFELENKISSAEYKNITSKPSNGKLKDGLTMTRIGEIMKPEPGNPMETEGVLNPAVIRGRDGQLYLFPRIVAHGNYSRIGISRVLFEKSGDPYGVERLGYALEPTEEYELRPDGGGCEDPRISFFEPLQKYLMTYTALSPKGPRIAMAISDDLFHWDKLGLAMFESFRDIDFANVDDKDSCVFPTPILNHAGKMQMAILHRPLFRGTRPEETVHNPKTRTVDLEHETIWISYSPLPDVNEKPIKLGLFNSHHPLATPVYPWEILKIGVGTPPIMTRHGWLIIYHGVSKIEGSNLLPNRLCYSAGMMILSKEHPRGIKYRSTEPILFPELPEERIGIIANVVFPTGIDQRNDLGKPDRFDVYYGMADNRVGVARLDLPENLPAWKPPEEFRAKV